MKAVVLSILVLAVLVGLAVAQDPYPAAPEPNGLPEQAYQILKQRCYECHGVEFSEAGLNVLDRNVLVQDRGQGRAPYVTAGDPAASKIWEQIEHDLMPQGGEPLSADEKALIKAWIEAGAPFPAAPASERPFIGRLAVLKMVRGHLQDVDRSDRPFQRYFSIVHLHNNRSVPDEVLRLHRAALSKAINSLSRTSEIVIPQAVDEYGTMYAIDLRDVGWDDRSAAGVFEVWGEVIKRYPYGLRPTQIADLQEYRDIEELYGAVNFDRVPYVRADWFVSEATRPPLYHTLADIPATLAELETRLGVNRQEDFEQGRLIRGAVVKSGVSAQNRLIDYHRQRGGSYWISYDFEENSGRSNLARFPLGPKFEGNDFDVSAFEHAGNEVVFTLPNGLHGYMIVQADGARLDAAPITIVRDLAETSGTPLVVNGISCMGCHRAGIKDFADEIIATGVAVTDEQGSGKIDDLFKPQEMARRLRNDREDYLRVLDEVMGPFLKQGDDADKTIEQFPEPISAVAQRYDGDLTVAEAAYELGFESPDPLSNSLPTSRALRSLGLGPLTSGKTIKRSMWDSREGTSSPFQDAAVQLDLGVAIAQ